MLRFCLEFVNEIPVGFPRRRTGRRALSVKLSYLKLYRDWPHSDSAFRCACRLSERHVLPARGGLSGLVLPSLPQAIKAPQTYLESTSSNLGRSVTPRPARASRMASDHFQLRAGAVSDQFVHPGHAKHILLGRDDEAGNRVRIWRWLSCRSAHGIAGNIKFSHPGKIRNSGRGPQSGHLRRKHLVHRHDFRVVPPRLRRRGPGSYVRHRTRVIRHRERSDPVLVNSTLFPPRGRSRLIVPIMKRFNHLGDAIECRLN